MVVDEDTALVELCPLTEIAAILPFGNPALEFCGEVGRQRPLVTSERRAPSWDDCFGVATARALDDELLIADHREFAPIAVMGL